MDMNHIPLMSFRFFGFSKTCFFLLESEHERMLTGLLLSVGFFLVLFYITPSLNPTSLLLVTFSTG